MASLNESMPMAPSPPRRSETLRMLIILSAGLAVMVAALWLSDSEELTSVAFGAGIVVLAANRFDYLHPAVAYLTPWLAILFFSTLPISDYSRNLNISTTQFLLVAIFTWLLATLRVPVSPSESPMRQTAQSRSVRDRTPRRLRIGIVVGFVLLYSFAALSIAYAGYVPLLQLFAGNGSGYAEFGIPGVYGAFLAYSNAMACLALYNYLLRKRGFYLFLYFSVLAMHLLLVSRQNLVTLLVEGFVIRSLLVRRISGTGIAIAIVLALSALAALGDLRSGNLGEVIGLSEDYDWVPSGFLWLYAYSYFNALNLENMMSHSGAPFFDGSMWGALLPSFLRPQIDHGNYLELEALNVASYIYPIYLDVGPVGVVVCTALFGWLTSVIYRRALRRYQFVDVSSYACLYGCAVLSFFVNFWFYLPVIFQIVFFRVFHALLFKERKKTTASDMAALAPSGDIRA
jgi:oligosaccharide repeat unit polymerase